MTSRLKSMKQCASASVEDPRTPHAITILYISLRRIYRRRCIFKNIERAVRALLVLIIPSISKLQAMRLLEHKRTG